MLLDYLSIFFCSKEFYILFQRLIKSTTRPLNLNNRLHSYPNKMDIGVLDKYFDRSSKES